MEDQLIGWRILSAVDQIQPGKYAKTRARNWKSDYSPEFLMLEMMAQTGGLIVGAVKDFSGNVVFAKVENANFQCTAYSVQRTAEDFVPCTIYDAPFVIEAFANDGVSDQGSWIDAHVLSGEEKIASARLFLIDAGDLSGNGKSLTFHQEFLEYYQIRQKTND